MVIKVECKQNRKIKKKSREDGKFCILITGTVDGDGFHPFNDSQEARELSCSLYREGGYASCFDFLNVVEADYYDYNGEL